MSIYHRYTASWSHGYDADERPDGIKPIECYSFEQAKKFLLEPLLLTQFNGETGQREVLDRAGVVAMITHDVCEIDEEHIAARKGLRRARVDATGKMLASEEQPYVRRFAAKKIGSGNDAKWTLEPLDPPKKTAVK